MSDAPISQICIVDDDSDFVEFLCQYLGVRGLAATGFAAAEALLKSDDIAKFDFFILDLGLPVTCTPDWYRSEVESFALMTLSRDCIRPE